MRSASQSNFRFSIFDFKYAVDMSGARAVAGLSLVHSLLDLSQKLRCSLGHVMALKLRELPVSFWRPASSDRDCYQILYIPEDYLAN